MLDLDLDVLTDVKKNRNAQKMAGSGDVSYYSRYSEPDPNNPNDMVTVLGNPSLSDVRVVMVGVRNRSTNTKECTVWVDELRVTDFDQEGGWAAKVNANLSLSDIATINFGYHKETTGFGSVDQGLQNRRMDNYDNINVAVQVDMGRFLPEKVKLKAPVYYSYTNQKTTPKLCERVPVWLLLYVIDYLAKYKKL